MSKKIEDKLETHKSNSELIKQRISMFGICQPIFDELDKSVAKFPTWPTDPLHALAILGEEFGELTKDVLQLTYEPNKTVMHNMRLEALQTAAMAIQFYLSFDSYEFKRAKQHVKYTAPTAGISSSV